MTCQCGTEVSAFTDSMLKHMGTEHLEPTTEFLKKHFEGMPE